MMEQLALTGILHGNTITLDLPVPALDGRRVFVILAAEELEMVLRGDEQASLWNEWALRGPQGPIEDDGQPDR
jgi:hypothetical protein